MAATLANGGTNPVSGERVIREDVARWTTSVMTSCGMYDASGDWLVHVGLPAKSGVGGGIVAMQPEQFGIGTFSPRLDERGNSVRGIVVLRTLSERYGLHMLQHLGAPHSPIAQLTRDDRRRRRAAATRSRSSAARSSSPARRRCSPGSHRSSATTDASCSTSRT